MRYVATCFLCEARKASKQEGSKTREASKQGRHQSKEGIKAREASKQGRHKTRKLAKQENKQVSEPLGYIYLCSNSNFLKAAVI